MSLYPGTCQGGPTILHTIIVIGKVQLKLEVTQKLINSSTIPLEWADGVASAWKAVIIVSSTSSALIEYARTPLHTKAHTICGTQHTIQQQQQQQRQ